jgi:dihydrofolate synthase/folylpolyglutamate synthase
VVAKQRPEAARVIQRRAEAVGAPLAWEGIDWSMRSDGGGVVFEDGRRSNPYPPPGLAGAHQVANAGVAVASVRRLASLNIDDEVIATGLRRATWPARLQRLGTGPLRQLLPEDWELWLDGGHNPAAGEALARHIQTWTDKPVHLVFGGLRNKDAQGLLAPLAPYVSRLVTVAIPGQENCLTAEESARAGSAAGLAGEAADSLEDALTRLAGDNREPARVLICGSLYLAGAVLAANRC